MSRPALTVLTKPILSAPTRAYRSARRALRPFVKPGVPVPAASPYPGHYALTRSVVEGLREIRADFNFNPASFADLARVVYAPANEALRQAISLKRRGDVDYLVAGPVNALFSDECDGILKSSEIDRLVVASDWVVDLYDDAPELKRKSQVCPCGVDPVFWTPSSARKDAAVVYWKSGTVEFCERVEAAVAAAGWTPIRVASAAGDFSKFTAEQFREQLDRAAVAIFLSSFETQGIALAEAWAMDVPTIVWNPGGRAEWRGRSFASVTSCPYLTSATGVDWRTFDELDSALTEVLANRGRFYPREWVLKHMTDAICARQLHRLIFEGASPFAAAG
ncbi:MAG TPA: hypothetical protein VH583_24115 [Vicinamibacterales bacterium]|jgi:hypothetical protein